MNAASRIIVPLDVPTEAQAMSLVDLLLGKVGMFKVGLQLFSAAGPTVVRQIVDAGGRVFLDLKLHDIPSTVARATEQAVRLGVSLMDVHLTGGEAMVRAAVGAIRSSTAGGDGGPRLLGITVLTSLDDSDLETIGMVGPVARRVESLAVAGQALGLDGVVASPQEIARIRKACGDGFLVVTPGIRPAGSDTGDQKRVMTPAQAVAAGADYLVVGRPITGARDPVAAAGAIADEMET